MTAKQIAGYAAFLLQVQSGRYRFDCDGRIFCGRTNKPAARLNRNGYLRVPFRFAGHRFEIMAHVAHWIYQTGKWPTGKLQINHRDMRRSNNHVSNLELVTQSENIRHRIEVRRNADNHNHQD